MQTLAVGLFGFLYLGCVVAVVILVLWLLSRFVSAQEKMAASLEVIARKLKDEDRR